MTKFVGDFGWECGPIVVAPPALLELWSKAFGANEAKALKAAKAIDVARFGDHRALILNGGKQTAWHPKEQVFVRLGGKGVLQPKVKVALAEVPAADESKWTSTKLKLTVAGGRGLIAFDGRAHQKVPKPYKGRGSNRLELDLPDGDYLIESIPSMKHEAFVVGLIRLYRQGAKPVVRASPKRAKTAKKVTPKVTAEIRSAFENMTWVGAADGAASIIVPVETAAKWREDWEIGSKGVGEVITIGGRDALVMGDPGPTAIHALPGGGAVIVKQTIGGGPGVLAAALAVPEGAWKKTKKKLDTGSGKLAVIDAGEDGPTKPAGVAIGAGVYTIDEHPGFEVTVGRAKIEVQLVRLRP